MILLITCFAALRASGLATKIEVRQCGFFVSCQPGNSREKVEVTYSAPANATSIPIYALNLIGFIALAIALSRYDNKWHFIGTSVVTVVWLGVLGLGTVGIVSALDSFDGNTKLIGSLSNEEYGCHLRSMQALDTFTIPENCPSSPESEAYFDMSNLAE